MELKHLRVLFTSVGRVVCNDKDAELIFQKEKSTECESEADDLSFDLVEHNEIRSQIQSAEMGFFQSVFGVSLSNRSSTSK